MNKFKIGASYVHTSDDGDTLKLTESQSSKNYSAHVRMQHESFLVPNVIEYTYYNMVSGNFLSEAGEPVQYNGVDATPTDADYGYTGLPAGWTDAEGNTVNFRVAVQAYYYDANWNRTGQAMTISGEYKYPAYPSFDDTTHLLSEPYVDINGVEIKYARRYVSYDFIFKNDLDEVTGIPAYDADGLAMEPEYEDDGWTIKTPIYDGTGPSKKLVTKRVPFMPKCPALSVNSSFKIDESWMDGEIKRLSFYGMLEPIKINAKAEFFVNGSSMYENSSKRKGPVAITLNHSNDVTSYIFLHSFFNILVSNEYALMENYVGAYNVEITLIRKGRDIEILGAEYEIPYYMLDEGEYSYGILKYRSTASNGTTSMPSANSVKLFTLNNSGAGPFASATSSEKIVSALVTINSDWMPFGDSGYCGEGSQYSDSFMLDLNVVDGGDPVASKMNLSIQSLGKQSLATENMG